MAKMTPRTLSGFMELLPAPQQQMERIMEILRRTYSLYGFTPLDTPVIESSDVLLAKAGGETEKQIYRFQKGDSDLSLRFDLTVPLAKYVALHYNDLSFPFRRYQIGKVYRGERAQRGRFREFYQADIDIIGDGKLSIINEAEIPAIIYKTFFQHLRIRQGRIFSGFENIHPAIIGYVRSSERLMKISADITRSCFGGKAFSEQEILSVAMMLFEMYDEPEEFCAFVEATFPEEANDLYRMVDGYLLRSYGFSITGLYSSILRTTLYRLIIHHQMGLLSEHAGHSESRAQIISDYPLVMLLYQNIQQLLAERYGNEAAGICCAPLCELIAFYIQGMDYAAPRLRIGITARSDIYAPEMIRNLLLAKLNPRYYSSVECCTYVDMLENIPEARKKYDLILCDERLSNDPLFLSYAEIRNDLNNINAYLQMLRDLFGNDLKKEDIRTQELKLSDGWAEELLAESRAFPVAAFTVEEIQKKTICVNDCLVLLLTQQTAPHSLLQFGKLKSRLRVGDKRVSRYLLLSGRVNAQNIRIINLLLYELIQDPLFWATLTSCPCPETLNNQINRLLK